MRTRVLVVVLAAALVLTPAAAAVPATGNNSTSTTGQPLPAQETKTGIAITLNEQTEAQYLSRITSIAEEYGLEAPDHAFILYTEQKSWIVATDSKPKDGKATVTGQTVPSTNSNTAGLLFASSVSVTETGTRVSRSAVMGNPQQYDGELLRVSGNYRQVAWALEAGDGQVVTQHTFGMFTSRDRPLIEHPGDQGRWATFNLSGDSAGATPSLSAVSRLGVKRPLADSVEPRWWVNANATVDFAVIHQNGTTTLSVVRVTVNGEEVSGPAEIHERGQSLQGDVVTMETQVVGSRLSTQEAVLAAARCAPGSATNPVTGCIPIPADATVHSGVLFQGVPENRTDAVVYAGLSSHHQTTLAEQETGTYQVTGRVVSTEEIDPDLPDGYALLVYDMERVGGLQAEAEAESRAREWSGVVKNELRGQMTSASSPSSGSPDDGTDQTTKTATTESTTMSTSSTSTRTTSAATQSNDGGSDGKQAFIYGIPRPLLVFGSWISAGLLWVAAIGVECYRLVASWRGREPAVSGWGVLSVVVAATAFAAYGYVALDYSPPVVAAVGATILTLTGGVISTSR